MRFEVPYVFDEIVDIDKNQPRVDNCPNSEEESWRGNPEWELVADLFVFVDPHEVVDH